MCLGLLHFHFAVAVPLNDTSSQNMWFFSDNAGVIVNVKGEMKGEIKFQIFCLIKFLMLCWCKVNLMSRGSIIFSLKKSNLVCTLPSDYKLHCFCFFNKHQQSLSYDGPQLSRHNQFSLWSTTVMTQQPIFIVAHNSHSTTTRFHCDPQLP